MWFCWRKDGVSTFVRDLEIRPMKVCSGRKMGVINQVFWSYQVQFSLALWPLLTPLVIPINVEILIYSRMQIL